MIRRAWMQEYEKLKYDTSNENMANILISATFTADLLYDTLQFFFQKLCFSCNIEFTSYNQVLQQLLEPGSMFLSNKKGVNMILIRFEDWYRYASKSLSLEIKTELVRQNAEEYIEAIIHQNSSVPCIVCICPSSIDAECQLHNIFLETELKFKEKLAGLNGVHVIVRKDIEERYPVQNYYDDDMNRLAHIPYTEEYFTALATMLARKVYNLCFPAHKVILVDCDNTLWNGVCGECDNSELHITGHFQKLQMFLEEKRKEGMLIGICSKNALEDVERVFETHPEMVLKKESIVTWHCNWNLKSENVKSIASELGLSMNSMIFLDDNPLECAEVASNCPEVLVMQFEDSDKRMEQIIHHVWAFDQHSVTKEDKDRTLFYQQNLKREQLKLNAVSYEKFILGLQLIVEFEPVSSSNISRISQLTFRTNQFNFTTFRRTEKQIEHMCLQEGYECVAVRAKDRFGDYGMVGVILYSIDEGEAKIDTFCLSCRALGRNIEHKMIEYIASKSAQQGVETISILYLPTIKNQPAYQFLNQIAYCQTKKEDDTCIFTISVADGLQISSKTIKKLRDIENQEITNVVMKEPETTVTKNQTSNNYGEVLSYIARELSDVGNIVREIKKQALPMRSERVMKQETPIEEKLTSVWREYLHMDDISITDDFFTMGGTSILMMRIISQVKHDFDVEIPLKMAFEGEFTIVRLAKEIVMQKLKNIQEEIIKKNIAYIENLSEEQMNQMLSMM